jgi:hypothetical protein
LSHDFTDDEVTLYPFQMRGSGFLLVLLDILIVETQQVSDLVKFSDELALVIRQLVSGLLSSSLSHDL